MPGCVTLKSRQRRMMDWMNTDLAYRFIAIGRTSPWPDENNPPYPDETQTEVEELIGLQRVDSYKFANSSLILLNRLDFSDCKPISPDSNRPTRKRGKNSLIATFMSRC